MHLNGKKFAVQVYLFKEVKCVLQIRKMLLKCSNELEHQSVKDEHVTIKMKLQRGSLMGRDLVLSFILAGRALSRIQVITGDGEKWTPGGE